MGEKYESICRENNHNNFLSFLTLGFVFTNGTARSIVSQSTTPIPTTNNSPTQETIISASDVEIGNLKLQLEEIKKHNDQLIQLIYTVLGVTLALVLAIVGINWYSSYRLYQSDAKRYEIEIDQKINKETALLKIDLGEQMVEIKEMLDGKVNSINGMVSESVKKNLGPIIKKVESLELDILDLEARIWSDKGVHANAIRAYLSIVTLSKSDYGITSSLKSIIESLRKMGKDQLFADHISSIEKAINTLPPNFNSLVQEIRNLYMEKMRDD